MKIDILSLNLEELSSALDTLAQPKFRAKQIFNWLHIKKVFDFSKMRNLPKTLIAVLDERFFVPVLSIEKKIVSEIDRTTKYLLRLYDGNYIETVLMYQNHGNSVCISTQVGCRMGCTFCASTGVGFVRNLEASEILLQLYMVSIDCEEKVSSVVLMGIGEPLDNFTNVVKFLELVSHKDGNNLSHRHISISTCGLVDKIEALQKLNLQITLSISLHAPFDDIRNQTMPINQKYDISELVAACRKYANVTKRRVSYEYAMIRGVNDSKECAMELVRILKGSLCHINLIPINSIDGVNFQSSFDLDINKFYDYLTQKGITTTIRRTRGADIAAACGQLRRDTVNS